MARRFKIVEFSLYILIIFILSGCGFTPIYNQIAFPTSDNYCHLNAIDITYSGMNIVESRFYFYLQDILSYNRNYKKKYILKIQFHSYNFPAAIAKKSDVIRGGINKKLEYILFDKNTNLELTRGYINKITSYNLDLSMYPSYTESEFAEEMMLREMAEELRTKLLFFFTSKDITNSHQL